MWTVNFQMFKLVLEKEEEPDIKLPASAGSSKKQEISQNTFDFCFIDYAKAFDCVDHNVCEVSQLCPTLCDPMDCSLPGSSIHGTLQSRVLEWGATLTCSFSNLEPVCCSMSSSVASWPAYRFLKRQVTKQMLELDMEQQIGYN